jgi:hypothetical protein
MAETSKPTRMAIAADFGRGALVSYRTVAGGMRLDGGGWES